MRCISIVILVLGVVILVSSYATRTLIEVRHLVTTSMIRGWDASEQMRKVVQQLDEANERNVRSFRVLYCLSGALILAACVGVYASCRRPASTKPLEGAADEQIGHGSA